MPAGSVDPAERASADKPQVAVVGTGLAGLSAALALSGLGVRLHLVGPPVDEAVVARDLRSTALFGPSLDFLERLGVMAALGPAAVPLVGLRLIDASGSLFRAPEVLFQASEIGRDAFGMNIENGPLLVALAACVRSAPGVQWHEAAVSSLAIEGDAARLDLDTGQSIAARLVVGADGARSVCRTAAGIAEHAWSYPQVAIAGRFEHRRPHRNVSTELHRRSGPLTTVPLAGNWSSLVWVETPDAAARLLGLDDAAFAAELERELGSGLGAVPAVGRRVGFPLSGVTAGVMGARRVALVGEAGHRLPPIGAQGLNLGLRDVAWLAQLVADAVADGGDPGAAAMLARYDDLRRRDVASRTAVVDLLNRSLIADLLPADVARSAGLAALKAVGPLRRLFMREGMAPGGPLPRLMQPVPPPAVPRSA